jgi:16S rRNA (guanine527-N7)-methyltransferase
MHDVPPDEVKRVVASSRAVYPALPAQSLEHYLAEVVRWNPRLGLVGKLGTPQILERLVKQSVRLLDLVSPRIGKGEGSEVSETSVVDVGSGGGFPGIVWALVRPRWRFLLVERRQRKASFLERTIRVLELERVAVHAGEASQVLVGERFAGQFHVATTMAVGPPERTGRLVEGFLGIGGLFATTIPREDPAPPPRAGAALELLETVADEDSRSALYIKSE